MGRYLQRGTGKGLLAELGLLLLLLLPVALLALPRRRGLLCWALLWTRLGELLTEWAPVQELPLQLAAGFSLLVSSAPVSWHLGLLSRGSR